MFGMDPIAQDEVITGLVYFGRRIISVYGFDKLKKAFRKGPWGRIRIGVRLLHQFPDAVRVSKGGKFRADRRYSTSAIGCWWRPIEKSGFSGYIEKQE
jgi:hypothetical protein